MRPLTLADLPDPERYASQRPALREAIIAHKRERRVALGDRVSLVFEDRETVRWQVLEMARVERIRDPRLLQQELDVYNELVPGEGELSATLFVEITELAEIRPELDRLVGLDEHLSLVLGDEPGETVRARFDAKQLEEERIAAVQYVVFPLSPDQQRRLADESAPARLRIDHPNYRVEVALPPATRASLLRDLAGGCAPLVDAGTPGARAPEPLEETTRLRAWRRTADLVELEPREAVQELGAADPALLAELHALAARLAETLPGRWELGVGLGERPLRWRLTRRRSA